MESKTVSPYVIRDVWRELAQDTFDRDTFWLLYQTSRFWLPNKEAWPSLALFAKKGRLARAAIRKCFDKAIDSGFPTTP